MVKLAGVSLLVRDARVLSVWNRTFKGWCLPGGKLEGFERPWRTAWRELQEETGVESLDEDGPIFVAPSDVDPERMVYLFRVLRYRGEPYGAEVGCPVAWMTQEEYLKGTCFPRYYEAMFRFYPVAAERQPTIVVEPSEPTALAP